MAARLLGMGGAGLDYLASVATFPQPDEKIRSTAFTVQGGGNSGNAATAAARLGCDVRIVTKVAEDGVGCQILDGLRAEGIDTGSVIVAPTGSSPFTYIIVDTAGATRTCIHTAGVALDASEMTPARVAAALDGVSLVSFDGRLTEAALVLASAARDRRIDVLVEAERLRPGLESLLATADFVVSSESFPHDWTGVVDTADALLATVARLPRAKWVLSTLGPGGAVLWERVPSPPGTDASPVLTISVALRRLMDAAAAAAPGTLPESGALSRPAVSTGPSWFNTERENDAPAAAARVAAASERAAATNGAPAGSAASYTSSPRPVSPGDAVYGRLVYCPAAAVSPAHVVDTTGAGDAFIGATATGILRGLPPERFMPLASYVAALKLRSLGARPGLPRWADIPGELLAAANH